MGSPGGSNSADLLLCNYCYKAINIGVKALYRISPFLWNLGYNWVTIVFLQAKFPIGQWEFFMALIDLPEQF